MGEWVKLTAADGHQLSAYMAKPAGEPIGALVVVQEIFGVNPHIRGVVDGYAKDGFVAIAPALFDRMGKDIELTYEGEDMKKAFELYKHLSKEKSLLDIAAAFEHVNGAGKGSGIIGYCYGGLMAWLSATRGNTVNVRPNCTLGYYPGGIGSVATEDPSCPVMLHFGADDDHIGKDQINAVREAHPEVEIFVYKGAGHGFNCDARGSYNPAASKLARQRSLEFLKKHIA